MQKFIRCSKKQNANNDILVTYLLKWVFIYNICVISIDIDFIKISSGGMGFIQYFGILGLIL